MKSVYRVVLTSNGQFVRGVVPYGLTGDEIAEAYKQLRAAGYGGSLFTENGQEVLDPSKPELPLGFKRPESLQEQIRRLIRTEVSASAQQAGHETFEEADDFDVGDDYDPRSPYEEQFEPEDPVEVKEEIAKRVRSKRKKVSPGQGNAPKDPPESSPAGSKGSGDRGPQDK